MSVRGGRAWTYVEIRKECFLHHLEEDKSDLNLQNPEVQQELEAYSDFKHNQTWNHPENAKILQAWKSVLDVYSTKPDGEKILIITAEDDLNTTMRYIDASVTIVRVNPLSGKGASLAERIETTLNDADLQRIGWMFSDKYSSRLASRESPQLTKALLTLQATLSGVPFNYYENEIRMTDYPDLPVPFKYRTPMQWNSKGTGFSIKRPWLPRTPNYATVNVETEEAFGDEYTTLKVYKSAETERDGIIPIRRDEGVPGRRPIDVHQEG